MGCLSVCLSVCLSSGVYGLEVKCSASHAKGTGFDPRSVHACFSVIRPTVLIFPSSLHVKYPLLVPELGQSSKIPNSLSNPFSLICVCLSCIWKLIADKMYSFTR